MSVARTASDTAPMDQLRRPWFLPAAASTWLVTPQPSTPERALLACTARWPLLLTVQLLQRQVASWGQRSVQNLQARVADRAPCDLSPSQGAAPTSVRHARASRPPPAPHLRPSRPSPTARHSLRPTPHRIHSLDTGPSSQHPPPHTLPGSARRPHADNLRRSRRTVHATGGITIRPCTPRPWARNCGPGGRGQSDLC